MISEYPRVEVVAIKIEWLGHACFLILSAAGTRIVTDPFNEEVGYPLPHVEADIVTVSHQHFDHNAVSVVRGRPRVVEGPGEYRMEEVSVRGVATFHDKEQGQKRGTNTVFVITVDGLTVCHLGDLGHLLSPEQSSLIGPVDVLLIPVGGTYTIDAREAIETVSALRPRVVIPMHYKTEYMNFPITGVDEFTGHFKQVARRNYFEVSAESGLGQDPVVVLAFAGEKVRS